MMLFDRFEWRLMMLSSSSRRRGDGFEDFAFLIHSRIDSACSGGSRRLAADERFPNAYFACVPPVRAHDVSGPRRSIHSSESRLIRPSETVDLAETDHRAPRHRGDPSPTPPNVR
jgi:hypothetical protein